MPIHRMPMFRARLAAGTLILALAASLIPLASASAVTIGLTGATGGGALSADHAQSGGDGAFTTLTGPSLQEGAAGDLTTGTILIDVASGFHFMNGDSGTVSLTGGSCAGMTTSGWTSTATVVTLTINTASTGACTLTWNGIEVRPINTTLPNTGNMSLGGGTSDAPSGNYGTLTEVPGAPVLSFATQPSASDTAGVAFATQPKVNDVDQFANVRTGDSILLQITPATGPVGASVTCTAANPVVTNGSGNAQFAGCSVDKANNGYRLRASTLSSVVDSTTFNVVPGAADHLIFQGYPTSPTGALLTPQPVVAVVDLGGNVIVGDTRAIALGISLNPGSFTCTGGLTKNAVAGVATFAGCTETVVASNYHLTATASGLPVATGAAFNVTSGPATNLLICWGVTLPCVTTPPASVLGGTAFSVQPTVRITDINGNQVPNDNSTVVTLLITPGSPTSGGPGTLTCLGGLTKTVTSGVATYSGCSIDRAGTAYQLAATSAPAFTSTTTNPFNVTVGAPVKLGFATQPAAASANTVFPTTVTVAIEDAGNNVITTGITATIALAISANPSAGTLTCTSGLQVATIAGVATFAGCSINNQGNNYTLAASAVSVNPVTTLTAAASVPFNVIAPASSITLTPSASVITWSDTVVLTVHFGANGSGKSAQLQAAIDGVNWAPVTNLTTDPSGNFTFSYRPATNLYYRVLFAGTPDLLAGLSNTTRVVVRQIALLRPTLSGHVRTIAHGTTITFTTTVRPNRPGQLPPGNVRFVLYKLVNGHWSLSKTVHVTADSGGIARWAWASTAGTWYVRSIADPNLFNANSVWSQLERYNVF